MKSSLGASFRDPSGFVYKENGEIYRVVNRVYKEDYDHLKKSGLYSKLVKEKLLVKHRELSVGGDKKVYKLIKPEFVKYISYPYEWSFNQLKDVALTALRIEKIALNHGMSLKDASAYNFQFVNLKPVLIDTLSFERVKEGSPWIAYKQFCQHFLAPLALSYYRDQRLNNLLKHYLDGIPLDLVSKLLPRSTYLKMPLLINLHLHAKSQDVFSQKSQLKRIEKLPGQKISLNSVKALVENLETAIKGLEWKHEESFWKKYYKDNSYSATSFKNKEKIIDKFLSACTGSRSVLDLGSNLGIFSFISAKKELETIALDYDHACIDRTYSLAKAKGYKNILPVVNDLSNPSPDLGWDQNERGGLIGRFEVDVVMALALMHHLIIGNNVPLNKVVDFMEKMTKKYLIIEYVPTDDVQVKEMVMLRSDWHSYSKSDFLGAFAKKFKLLKEAKVSNKSGRIIYLLRRKT